MVAVAVNGIHVPAATARRRRRSCWATGGCRSSASPTSTTTCSRSTPSPATRSRCTCSRARRWRPTCAISSPDGVIVFQATNRFVDIAPVVERLAAEFGMTAVLVSDCAGEQRGRGLLDLRHRPDHRHRRTRAAGRRADPVGGGAAARRVPTSASGPTTSTTLADASSSSDSDGPLRTVAEILCNPDASPSITPRSRPCSAVTHKVIHKNCELFLTVRAGPRRGARRDAAAVAQVRPGALVRGVGASPPASVTYLASNSRHYAGSVTPCALRAMRCVPGLQLAARAALRREPVAGLPRRPAGHATAGRRGPGYQHPGNARLARLSGQRPAAPSGH